MFRPAGVQASVGPTAHARAAAADNRGMSQDQTIIDQDVRAMGAAVHTGEGAAAAAAVPEGLVRAAQTGALLAQLPAVAVEATGADAAPFLHGQFANDVSGLPVGGVGRTLHLNHKGHAIAEASVLRRGKADLLLVIDDDRADWVLESLDSHIVFDQVTLKRQPGLALLTLQGGGATDLLGEAPEASRYAQLQLDGVEVVAFPRRRSAAGGFDLLVPAERLDALTGALSSRGATVVEPGVIDALRVLAGVPTAAGEGGDGVLPQEAGLEEALSYRKGCYLGQEIMARIEARGNLRRSLARLRLSGRPADGERTISAGGRMVGRLGTVAEFENEAGDRVIEALAVLRNDLPADAELEAAGVRAEVLHGASAPRYNQP